MIKPEAMLTDVKQFLLTLQEQIVATLKFIDPSAPIEKKMWHSELGSGISYRLLDGTVIEKGGINFSHVSGHHLPAAATEKRPELLGCTYQAIGLSIVIHPLNPYIPTSHANLRLFIAEKQKQKPLWWFGGGFDLTPYYGFDEDCYYWHAMAKKACDSFGTQVYFQFKKECDNYFYLKHRQEPRGIGGLFFDDLNEWGFAESFNFIKSVGNCFHETYPTIILRRKECSYSESQKQFQLYRRGRYIEFNLLYDRGTLFGLQSGGNPELILMSLPPMVSWRNEWHYEPHSPEEKLIKYYLIPRDWLAIRPSTS